MIIAQVYKRSKLAGRLREVTLFSVFVHLLICVGEVYSRIPKSDQTVALQKFICARFFVSKVPTPVSPLYPQVHLAQTT